MEGKQKKRKNLHFIFLGGSMHYILDLIFNSLGVFILKNENRISLIKSMDLGNRRGIFYKNSLKRSFYKWDLTYKK